MILYKWRVWCETEGAYVTTPGYMVEAPTACPNNEGHTLTSDPDKIMKVGSTFDHEIVIKPITTGTKTLIDGAAVDFEADKTAKVDLTMPVDVHIQTVKVRWKSCFTGDHGWLTIIHPSGTTPPAVAISIDDTTVTVPAGLGAVYAAAKYMEFWNDADDALVEMREIDSVAGDVVTLKTAVTHAHSLSATLRAVLDSYSPPQGTDGISAGLQLIENGAEQIRSENEFTAKIAAGLIIGSRFLATSDVGTRKVSVNYRFRQCDGTCGE